MFERRTKEQLFDNMRKYSRSVSPKLTDFRRGSVIRTVYEAIARTVEGLYDSVFRSNREMIQSNLYATVGFEKEQAVPSSGIVVFGASEANLEDVLIPENTEVVAEVNAYRPPLTFVTTEDVILRAGYTTVEAPVTCLEAGMDTNIEAGDIYAFVRKPFGIDTVTNPLSFTNGKDEETPDAQKSRFQDYMESRARGTLQSIAYGAKQARVTVGETTEQVLQAAALEDLEDRLGQVDLYIWNGKGAPSEALKAEVAKVIRGYTDTNGEPVYGYKNGGTIVNIYPANPIYAKIKIKLSLQNWASEAEVRKGVEQELAAFFYRVRMGQTLIMSELVALVKSVSGVYDVRIERAKLTGSTETFVQENIAAAAHEIIVQGPLLFETM